MYSYLHTGGFATEDEAARAYDRAAIVYYGPNTQLNGKLTDYNHELSTLQNLSREQVVSVFPVPVSRTVY